MAQGGSGIAGMLVGNALESARQPAQGTPGSGIEIGVGIAKHVDQVRQQREQLELQKQQLESQKDEKILSAMEAGMKLDNPSVRKTYFGKYVPNMLKALGRQDMFSPEVYEMFQGAPDIGMNKIYNAIREVREGRMTREQAMGMFKNPEEFALAQEYNKEFAQAEEGARDYKERLNVASVQYGYKDKYGDEKDFDDLGIKLADRVQDKFTKEVVAPREAIRESYAGLQTILSDLRAGKKANSIDFNVAARGLAKAKNSGAMTDADVNDFKQLTGLEEITEDAIRKWLIGGANVDAVNALLRIAERAGTSTDRKASTLAKSFEGQFESPRFAGRADELRRRSGIDAFMEPTLKPKGKKDRDVIDVGGREVFLDDLKSFYAKSKDKAKFIKDMATKTGKSNEETKKLLEGK